MKKVGWLLLWMACVIIFFTGCSFLKEGGKDKGQIENIVSEENVGTAIEILVTEEDKTGC